MAAIDIPGVGEAFLGGNPQVVKVKKVTLGVDTGDVRAVDSEGAGAQGTYPLFNVPAGVIVLDVKSNVNEAWTASVTITIGDGTDADGFLASAKIAPQSAVSSGVLKSMLSGTQEAFAGGRKYTAADTIDAVVGGADPTQGELDVWLFYIEDQSQL